MSFVYYLKCLKNVIPIGVFFWGGRAKKPLELLFFCTNLVEMHVPETLDMYFSVVFFRDCGGGNFCEIFKLNFLAYPLI